MALQKSTKKIHFKNSAAMSLSRNHDAVTRNNSQTLLREIACRDYFLSTELHLPTISKGGYFTLESVGTINMSKMVLQYKQLGLGSPKDILCITIQLLLLITTNSAAATANCPAWCTARGEMERRCAAVRGMLTKITVCVEINDKTNYFAPIISTGALSPY